jgi:hypothetical protein
VAEGNKLGFQGLAMGLACVDHGELLERDAGGGADHVLLLLPDAVLLLPSSEHPFLSSLRERKGSEGGWG